MFQRFILAFFIAAALLFTGVRSARADGASCRTCAQKASSECRKDCKDLACSTKCMNATTSTTCKAECMVDGCTAPGAPCKCSNGASGTCAANDGFGVRFMQCACKGGKK